MDSSEALFSEGNRHLSVEFVQCIDTFAASGWGQYITLCIVWKYLANYMNKQWFQGIFITILFSMNSLYWIAIMSLLWVIWLFKEMYITTATDYVRFNDAGYVPT